MTTTLTQAGWFGPVTNGVWTNLTDVVIDLTGGIEVLAGTVANTRGGNDSITGAGGFDNNKGFSFGIDNLGTIIMGNGKDSITGTATGTVIDATHRVYGIYNEENSTITMGNGNNDSITGTATGVVINFPGGFFPIAGIYNRSGTIIMGNGNNDSITGIGTDTGEDSLATGIFNRQGGTIAMGNGNNDSITGIGGYYNGIYNRGSISIGNGNHDSITGTGISDGAYGIYNQNFADIDPSVSSPSITMGNGNNASIIGTATGSLCIGIYNETASTIAVGNGNNDSITGTAIGSDGTGIRNETGGTIAMGNGNNDSITGTAIGRNGTGIVNETGGTITMGDGNNDSITGTAIGSKGVGIYNETDGTIKMGNGKDTITGTAIGSNGTGIVNETGGTIDAGGGNDTLMSSAIFNGVSQKVTLDGGGEIKMGIGNDYFQGFGKMTVFGDTGTGNSGFDKLNFGSLTLADFHSMGNSINKVGTGDNFAQFNYNGATMTTNEFERFIFADQTVNYSGLA